MRVEVTVQFESDGNDQNEIISHSERSVVDISKSESGIAYIQNESF